MLQQQFHSRHKKMLSGRSNFMAETLVLFIFGHSWRQQLLMWKVVNVLSVSREAHLRFSFSEKF